MKTTITTFLFLFFVAKTQAQERIVKAFSGAEFTYRDTKCFNFPNNYSSEEYLGLSKILLAKSKFHSRKHFSEWQLSNITLERNQIIRTETETQTGLTQVVLGEKASKFGFALAYTSNFLIKEKNNKNQFWLGGGIQSSNKYLYVEPLTSRSFPFVRYSSNFDLLLLPRFTRKINERFMLDIHIPIILQRFSAEYQLTRSPILPISSMRRFCNQYEWKPNIEQIRIGIGVFLDKKVWEEKKAEKKKGVK